MPVVNFERYCAMLDRAAAKKYAYPAINVLETNTLNAAIEGLAAAKSDGIVQITEAAGLLASGRLGDPVLGAITLAEHAHRLAERYDVNIAVHSDHCPTHKVDSFLAPLIEETARRRAAGLPNLFNSHMYDGSDVPLSKNLQHAAPLMAQCRRHDLILEVEAGVVGGEEDGRLGDETHRRKLYTTPEDMVMVYEALSKGHNGHFMLAATFGNVHGVYKPGAVVLKPEILKQGQDAVVAKHGEKARFWLVFHGGSGSSLAEIHESIEYGVVKMNIHTDTQYAFTRAVADHIMRNYDAVLKVDGDVGKKQAYLASAWLDRARNAMADRVVQACHELKSAGKTLGRS